MDILLMKLILQIVGATMKASVDEGNIGKEILKVCSNFGLTKGEKLIEKWAKESSSFGLEKMLKKNNISCENDVRCFVGNFLGQIDIETMIAEQGADKDKILSAIVRNFDEELKKDINLFNKLTGKQSEVEALLKEWLERMWDCLDKDKLILSRIAVNNEELKVILYEILDKLNEMQLETVLNTKFVSLVPNRADEYKEAWERPLFLDEPSSAWDEEKTIPVALADLHTIPLFVWKKNKKNSAEIGELLEKIATVEESRERMLVILGQPGSGKSSLLTYFLNEFDGQLGREIVLFRFVDFKVDDWDSVAIEELLQEQCGLDKKSLSGKILIFDGLDEVKVKGERLLEQLYDKFACEKEIKDFSIIVTCRENYINNNSLECSYITLWPLNEEQISQYYEKYCQKKKVTKLNIPLDILLQNKEVFGIPIVLYMTIASNIEVGTESTIVDIYDKIFDVDSDRGLYGVKNYRNEKHRIWIEENRKNIHEISRNIAIWMHQNNEGKEFIPKEQYQKTVEEQNMSVKDMNIGSFFKHWEGVAGTGTVCFVHRSIYQYFVADAIFDKIKDVVKSHTASDIEVFIKEIVPFIQVGVIDPTIGEYLKCKFEKMITSKEVRQDVFSWFEEVLLKAVERGFINLSCEQKISFLEMETKEMKCFVNMIAILQACVDWCKNRYILQDAPKENICLYLKHNGIRRNYKINLARFDLSAADLNEANLKEIDLAGANLEETNLKKADLERAYLEGANLKGANLKGSNLKGADMCRANLEGVNIKGVDMSKAYLAGANFGGTNLD